MRLGPGLRRVPRDVRRLFPWTLRGVGGIAPAPKPTEGNAGLLAGISGEMAGLAAAEAGIQVHEFRLENPIR